MYPKTSVLLLIFNQYKMRTTISNTTYYDKSNDEWVDNHNYKAVAGSRLYHTDKDFIEIITESLTEKLSQAPFKDSPLPENEIIYLKNTLEKRIKELLIGRKKLKYGNPTISFLGEKINLDISPIKGNPQDNFIRILYRAYQICEECLQENKPVYLSITEEKA